MMMYYDVRDVQIGLVTFTDVVYARYVVSLGIGMFFATSRSLSLEGRKNQNGWRKDGRRSAAGEDPPGCIYNVEIGWVEGY